MSAHLAHAKNRSCQRVARFRRLWEEALPAQAVAKVDLRYEYGAAVTFSDAGLAMRTAQKKGEG